MSTSRSHMHQTALLILSLLPAALSNGHDASAEATSSPPIRKLQNNNRPNKQNNRPNNRPNKQPTPSQSRPIPPFLGIDTLLSPTLIDDDRSHGTIFDIVTTPSSKSISITDIEFYTLTSEFGQDRASLNGLMIDYQIYAKEGSWHDVTIKEFSPISLGNMTLDFNFTDVEENNMGYSRHRIPLEDSIRLNGNGTRYSLYVGLSERIMLFQNPARDITDADANIVYVEGMDYIPLVETKDMVLYYGGGVMVYPLSKANHAVYFRKPRGFVGRIWYERDACMPSVVYWSECEGLSGGMSEDERIEEVEYGDTFYGGIASFGKENGGNASSSENSNAEAAPTVSPAPSVFGEQVYLVITFGEAPMGKMMDLTAQSTFERVLKEFYQEQDVLAINDVDLYSVKVWLQQFVLPEWAERALQGNSQRESAIVQYQITTILTITNSALPHLITRDLMLNALIDNQTPFFKSLKLTPELTPYLQNSGYIASIQFVDELTSPPTLSPTDAPTIATTEPIVVREPTPPLVIAAILLITIYTCSILFSTCYLKRARNEMEHDRDQERLLKSTTIEPDIKGSKADFEDKPLVEDKGKKKKGFRNTLFKKNKVVASSRNLMSNKNLMGGSKNDISYKSNGSESHSRERTSSAEDSSEGSYSSEDEESYESEESDDVSEDDSEELSIT
ncbi:hypothetical protein ACHAXN_006586 [Cyclotella atomus]